MHDCERHAERAFATVALGRGHTVVAGGRKDAHDAYMLHYNIELGGHPAPPLPKPATLPKRPLEDNSDIEDALEKARREDSEDPTDIPD